MQEKIGMTAGDIYRYLASNGENTTTTIRKKIDIEDPTLLSLGIGWLAREGKVQLRTRGKTVYVALTPDA